MAGTGGTSSSRSRLIRFIARGVTVDARARSACCCVSLSNSSTDIRRAWPVCAAGFASFDGGGGGDSLREKVGRLGNVPSRFSPSESRLLCLAGTGGAGGVVVVAAALVSSNRACTPATSTPGAVKLPRSVPAGDAGALLNLLSLSLSLSLSISPSNAALSASACRSAANALTTSGVELILLGLYLTLPPSSPSESVSVPSLPMATDGPASGEERSGRLSRRGLSVGERRGWRRVWRA